MARGLIVLADDDDLEWPKQVLANAQGNAAKLGFYVSRMSRKLHEYHLDDAPNLKSCNLFINSVPDNASNQAKRERISDPERLENFYGYSQEPRVRYIRELKRPDYGKAPQEEYKLEYLDEENPQ